MRKPKKDSGPVKSARRMNGVVERTKGALKRSQPALTAEQLGEVAEEAFAAEAAERAARP